MADPTTQPEPTGPEITVTPYQEQGCNVFADGALLGRYWPMKAPGPWDDTSHADALCEPGIHAEKPFHARPLFGLVTTHHSSTEAAVAALLRAREQPNREQVETIHGLFHHEPGALEAVRYARHILAEKGII